MLDGFVTAIVAGPVSMDPPEWICPLLGIDLDAFNHGDTPEFAAIAAVAVRHNTIVETLSTSPKTFEPILVSKPNRDIDVALWPGILRRNEIEIVGLEPAPESSRHQSRSIVADPASLRRRPWAPVARSAESRTTDPTALESRLQGNTACHRSHAPVLDADSIQDSIVVSPRVWDRQTAYS
jgi:hypothetical protein